MGSGSPDLLFSAHAEVFPAKGLLESKRRALLRACGGISDHGIAEVLARTSSPRMRRYFRVAGDLLHFVFLFSAHAEVFPA